MRPVLRSCVVLALLAAPASANEIRVTVEGKDGLFPSYPEHRLHEEGLLGQFILPGDLLQRGGEISLGWAPRRFDPYVYGWADVVLTFDRLTEGPPEAGSPAIRLRSNLLGEYELSRGQFWRGSWDSMWVFSSLEHENLDSDIPREVLELFLDEEAVTFHSEATTGGPPSSVINVSPAAVPEPSTLAAWGAVTLGALAIRQRFSSTKASAP
jgi:hypothetical protein